MTTKKKSRVKAYGGRFGPGKVHYLSGGHYGSHYETLCGRTVRGERTDEPVTCKLCLKSKKW